jgi:hypothetical protein
MIIRLKIQANLKGDLAIRSSRIFMSIKCSPISKGVNAADTILSIILRDSLMGKLDPEGAVKMSAKLKCIPKNFRDK